MNGWTYKFICSCKGCGDQAHIKEDKSLMTLEFNGRHHKDSHKGVVYSCITESQKKALDTVVRTNPLCRAKAARRATQNMLEDEKIPPEMMNRVRKNVRE